MARSGRGRPAGRFRTDEAGRVALRVDEVFSSLSGLPFLRPEDRTEFGYFRRLFRRACAGIDGRVASGALRPWSATALDALEAAVARDYPRRSDSAAPLPPRRARGGRGAEPAPSCLREPGGTVRAGIFIGSFDPFQMTHLETALRFLSRGRRPADLVFVVPEGAYSERKPGRSDYGYRYDILYRQAAAAFAPFVVPLDIGEGAGTIAIVERLLGIFAGRRLELTHVLGSDAFPYAAAWLPEDFAAWLPAARRNGVDLDFGMYVVKRDAADRTAEAARAARRLGVDLEVDPKPIGTPSSSDLRDRGVFTIVFPTQAVLEKLEVVFRYGMHRHWLTERGGPEFEI